MKRLLYAALCLQFLLGCTKEVTYSYDFPGKAIAVVARIDPTEGFTAYVTQGVPPQGSYEIEDLMIDNAVVEVVRDDGTRLQAAYKGDAQYQTESTSFFESNRRYRLEITHPDYPKVTSDWVDIPLPIEAASLERRTRIDNSKNQEVTDLLFSGRDPDGADFYLVEVYADGGFQPQFQVELSADFDSEFCELYNYHPPNGIFFRDLCFDHASFNFTLTLEENEFQVSGAPFTYNDFVFAIRHLDSTYYNFQLDRLNLDDIRGTILEASSPSTSNLTGGYGVFLASHSFVRRFEVQ